MKKISKIDKNKKGYTLLEILLVIGAIGILASIVVVAINPLRQIQKARDAEKESEINQIYKALEQYNIAEGRYPETVVLETEDIYKEICNTGKLTKDDALDLNFCDGKIDLRLLVPEYISEIPRDSSLGAMVQENILYQMVEANDGSKTGYEVALSSDNNRVSLKSTNPNINGEEIAINFIERPTAPVAITDLEVNIQGGEIKLTWSTPNDSKNPVTGYRLETIINNTIVINENLGLLNEYIIDKTEIDQLAQDGNITYQARLYAINAIGEGSESNQISLDIGVPDSVEDLLVSESGGQANLTWSQPNMNAGTFISYRIRYSEDNFQTYEEITIGNITEHSFIIENGYYKIMVFAENQYGLSTTPNNVISRSICSLGCVDNGGGDITINTNTIFTEDQFNIGTLTINSGVTLTTDKNIRANNLVVNGTIITPQGQGINMVLGTLTVNSGGSINVDGRGYQGGYNGNIENNGYGPGGGFGVGSAAGNGGGFGGAGGNSNSGILGGSEQYGSIENPIDMGSGGGRGYGTVGGNGGGIIRLEIGGDANIVGSISANGTNGGTWGGGGAGGSINLDISGVWSGTGSIIANGGNGNNGGGGGAGGRIAVRYGTKNHTGNISTNGGSGWQGGAAGTIWEFLQ